MLYSINNLSSKCGHKCILSKEKCCNCSDSNKVSEQYKYFCSICKTMPKYSIKKLSTISTIKEENHVLGFFT